MSCFCGNGFSFELGKRTYVMGILNFTPDSFSDGGDYFDVHSAVMRAEEMERYGADIIDLGACSTAPGRAQADAQTESERIKSVLPCIANAVSVPISVDTYRYEVAEYALNNGAVIVNDESGVFSEDIAKLIRKTDAGWIYMHTGGETSDSTAQYDSGITASVKASFLSFIKSAERAGIDRSRLCMDMGIGFGKTQENNAELIASAKELKIKDVALLTGLSRKRVIGYIAGENDLKERDAGTIAADTVAIAGGTDIIRVHNVKAAVSAARAADKLLRRSEWIK